MIRVEKDDKGTKVQIQGDGDIVLKELIQLFHTIFSETEITAQMLHELIDISAMSEENLVAEIFQQMPKIYEKASKGDKRAQELTKTFFDLMSDAAFKGNQS